MYSLPLWTFQPRAATCRADGSYVRRYIVSPALRQRQRTCQLSGAHVSQGEEGFEGAAAEDWGAIHKASEGLTDRATQGNSAAGDAGVPDRAPYFDGVESTHALPVCVRRRGWPRRHMSRAHVEPASHL
eukprot:scaffold930_cov408-Prasinococcus_capsulatus_cf.AAC.5